MTVLALAAPPDGFIENPFEIYASLREDAPVDFQPDGSAIVSRYSDLDLIYRDTTRFISDKRAVFEPKFGASPLYEHHTTSLVFNDPPLHTRVRRIMVGAMTPRAIARMEPGLVALVDELLEELGAEIDGIEDFASRIPIHVIGNLFDIPLSERAPLRDWSLAILGALEPVLSPEQHARGNTAVTEFCDYLRDLVARRRASPGDPETDVLTRLMISEDGELSEIELLQNCIFILNAGHETTTNLIGNALALLDQHRDARDRLIAHPELISTAVDEVLRLESPNQFGNRLTTQDVTIAGQTIPKGTDLHLCIGAANRDPRQFDAPQSFDITRRPNKHLAFAGGAHTCVGFTLARMEGRVAISHFLRRFPNYHQSGPAKRSPRLRFRGFEHLPLAL